MSVKKNFIYNISYQILIMIIPLITIPYISRVIGARGIGIQSYTYSIVSYFVLFAMLGINNHGNRSIAMIRDNKCELSKTFFSIYILQVITSIFVGIVYFFYITFMASEYKLYLLIQGIYILSNLLDINWFFFGMEQFKITVTRNIIIKILSVFFIFIFVKDSNDLYIYSLILAIGSLISQMILWKYLKNYIFFTKVNCKDIIRHIRPVLVLFIPVIAVSIYKIMDKIMLGFFSDIVEVGFFENAEKIIYIPIGIIVALGTVMLPKMSNLKAKGKIEESKKYISMSIDLIMFIAFGAMFGVIGVSPILIPIFLGNEFINCIDVVSFMSISLIFLAWANVIRTQFLIPNNMDKVYIISTILGAIVNLIFNIIFIKKYGAIGAAIGTILAEAIVALYQTIKIKNELPVYNYFKRNIFYVIPGLIMLLIIRIIGNICDDNLLTAMVQIIIGGSIYSVICYGYLIYIKNDVAINLYNKYKKLIYLDKSQKYK